MSNDNDGNKHNNVSEYSTKTSTFFLGDLMDVHGSNEITTLFGSDNINLLASAQLVGHRAPPSRNAKPINVQQLPKEEAGS